MKQMKNKKFSQTNAQIKNFSKVRIKIPIQCAIRILLQNSCEMAVSAVRFLSLGKQKQNLDDHISMVFRREKCFSAAQHEHDMTNSSEMNNTKYGMKKRETVSHYASN